MPGNLSQERDQDVVTFEKFAGLRNDVSPERFEPGDLAVATNIDIDQSGRLSRRQGFTSAVAGSAHSLWSDETEQIGLYVAGNQLMWLKPDLTHVAIKNLTNAAARMAYWGVNDRVYFSNGMDSGVFEAGAVRSWGLPVPPLPGVSTTVGYMPAGIYQFVVTYFRNDGQESGADLAGAISVSAGGGLNFTMPVSSDPTVTQKGLYLTTPNGGDLFLAMTVPNSQVTASYTNDTTELELPLNTQFFSAPPPGQVVAYYRGRMYVAAGDVIYPSVEYAYELFDLRLNILMSGQVTMLAPMEDKERGGEGQHSGFFAGTDESCGTIVGSEPQDFQYVHKMAYGAIAGAIDYVDGALFTDGSATTRPLPMWLTTQGLCIGMPDMEIRNLTRTKFNFAASGQGAALFMPEQQRFIANSNL
jgi:hypothetical protein